MTAKLSYTREEVLQAYSGDVSIGDAARTLGCGVSALTKLMRELDIPIKSRGRTGRHQSAIAQLNDRDWLYEQLVVQGRGQREVAEEIGTTGGNVAHYARKHNLYPQVSQSDATKAWLTRKFPGGRWGADAPRWNGGRRKAGEGYVQIYKPEHPHAKGNGCVYEHRLVMEEKIGRLLRPEEVVDHIDLDRSNNHPDNLRLHESKSAHMKDHFNARKELRALREELGQRVSELETKIAKLEEP